MGQICSCFQESALSRLLEERSDKDLTDKIRLGQQPDMLEDYMEITTTSLNDDTKVIKKRIRFQPKKMRVLANEMERGLRKWFILNHSNVLPLCGFVRESDTKIPSLVTERADYNGADHRSLQMILKKGENVDIISLIEGIADGLCYLHSSDIIHSDLRSTNVLVTRDRKAMLTNYGIQCVVYGTARSKYSRAIVESSLRWQAPEFVRDIELAQRITYTKQADIWALGMTFLEVITRRHPYAEYDDNQAIAQIRIQTLPRRPRFPATASNEENFVWNLCFQFCWDLNPERRSSASELLEMIRKFRDENRRRREEAEQATAAAQVEQDRVATAARETRRLQEERLATQARQRQEDGRRRADEALHLFQEEERRLEEARRQQAAAEAQRWREEEQRESAERLAIEAARRQEEEHLRQQQLEDIRLQQEERNRFEAEAACFRQQEEERRAAEARQQCENILQAELESRQRREEEERRAAEAARQEAEELLRRRQQDDSLRRQQEERQRLENERLHMVRQRQEEELRIAAEARRLQQERQQQEEEGRSEAEAARLREEIEQRRAAEAVRFRQEGYHIAEARRQQKEVSQQRERAERHAAETARRQDEKRQEHQDALRRQEETRRSEDETTRRRRSGQERRTEPLRNDTSSQGTDASAVPRNNPAEVQAGQVGSAARRVELISSNERRRLNPNDAWNDSSSLHSRNGVRDAGRLPKEASATSREEARNERIANESVIRGGAMGNGTENAANWR